MTKRLSRTEFRRRRILDLSLSELHPHDRVRMRARFALLAKQGFGARGFAYTLEETLNYVRRANAAIDILEGKNVNT